MKKSYIYIHFGPIFIFGLVLLTACGDNGSGPAFTDGRLDFAGDYESQDYSIHFLSESGSTVNIDTTVNVTIDSYIKIESVNGSTDEILIDLENFIRNGLNTVLIAFDLDSLTHIKVNDASVAKVSDSEFVLDEIDILLTVGTVTFRGEVAGRGVLENDGTITLNFEYYYQTPVKKNTILGDVVLSKQVD